MHNRYMHKMYIEYWIKCNLNIRKCVIIEVGKSLIKIKKKNKFEEEYKENLKAILTWSKEDKSIENVRNTKAGPDISFEVKE